MTRYFLVGGNWKFAGDGGARLCAALAPHLSPPAKMLICLFGRDPSEWDEQFGRVVPVFEKYLQHVSYELARPETFIQQIQDADVVYLNDGDNLLMERTMIDFQHLEAAFADKVIVASSAGANILSSVYYTRTYGMVRPGLGVLPIKFIAHYGIKLPQAGSVIAWEAAKRELKDYGDQAQPLYALQEGEFVELGEDGFPLSGNGSG
jgi:hypothetical protein